MTKSYDQHLYQAPSDATEVLLVRHGSSRGFVEGVEWPMLDDQGDPPLTEFGQRQAEAVGQRLASEAIDAIYVTKLRRTSQTAAPLVAATGIEPTVSPLLHEVALGEWERGVSRIKLAELTDPLAKEVVRTGTWDGIPGAEKWADFSARCRRGLDDIIAAHPGQNVVAFVHGGVISAIARQLVGGTERFGAIDNTSITRVALVEGKLSLFSFNDTAHLGAAFTRQRPPT